MSTRPWQIVVLVAVSLFVSILVLTGCEKPQIKATPTAIQVAEEIVSTETPTPEPTVIMTVTGMSWSRTINLNYQRITETHTGWELPKGAVKLSEEEVIDHSAIPQQYRIRYTYQIEVEKDYITSRQIRSEGLGTDPEPFWPEYSLKANEYVVEQVEFYYVQFTDADGIVWKWGPRSVLNFGGPSPRGWYSYQEPEAFSKYMEVSVGTPVLITEYGDREVNGNMEYNIVFNWELLSNK